MFFLWENKLLKQNLGGHKQNLVCTRTQKKGAVTPQETDPDLPVRVQESLAEAWAHTGLLQGRGTEYDSACTRPSEGGRHYLHQPHHNLVSGQITGRKHSPAHQQKIRDLLSTAPPVSTVPPTVSLSQQEASISLLSLSIRGQTE